MEKHGKELAVRTANAGSFDTDIVVRGAGRAPDLDALKLEAAGIEYSKRGIIDEQSADLQSLC